MSDFLRYLLMYGVVPLWVLAGLADWWCHKRTRIETSSGWKESLFHWVLFIQMGVGVFVALLMELNAIVFLLLVVLWLLHEFTSWLELRYVDHRRHILPAEQMVHSFLELLPLMGILTLGALNADHLLARGPENWQLDLKTGHLPWAYATAVLMAIGLLNVIPLAEETWRCVSAARRGKS